jgi:hypothetical protein
MRVIKNTQEVRQTCVHCLSEYYYEPNDILHDFNCDVVINGEIETKDYVRCPCCERKNVIKTSFIEIR